MAADLAALFDRRFGHPPTVVVPLAGGGSGKRMRRLVGANGERAVGVVAGGRAEARAFLSFTRALASAGLPVPDLLAVAEDERAWLLEDLGDTTLFAALEAARKATGEPFPARLRAPFQEAMTWLPRFQVEGGRVLDFRQAMGRPDFDRRAMLWDLAYFKYCFLKPARIPCDEDRLEDEFERLVAYLLPDDGRDFVYRDFQARNVMLVDDSRLVFLDYQGGRRGPLAYDVASFLTSARTALPPPVREDLLATYLDALAPRKPIDEERFRARLPAFAVLRILQALGAYGFRGLWERRPHFLASIGPATANLRALLDGEPGSLPLPEIGRVVDRIAARGDLAGPVPGPASGPPPGLLTVRVGSFSYRQGIPPAAGDHGGGFVFDCRALPNPGREARFRDLSGLDEAVRRHLETHAETGAFLARVQDLVDAHVETFLARGFTSLDVRFGCTGGQHRSVYFADRLASHLRAHFPGLRVVVEHAERHRWPEGATRPDRAAAT
ncbi:MAG: phosphotransferase [Planctomycetota bacterium]